MAVSSSDGLGVAREEAEESSSFVVKIVGGMGYAVWGRQVFL